MRVVSNTSPLANLAVIDRLELLWEQFGEVWIPQAVDRELERLRHHRAQESLLEAKQKRILRIDSIKNEAAVMLLTGLLD